MKRQKTPRLTQLYRLTPMEDWCNMSRARGRRTVTPSHPRSASLIGKRVRLCSRSVSPRDRAEIAN